MLSYRRIFQYIIICKGINPSFITIFVRLGHVSRFIWKWSQSDYRMGAIHILGTVAVSQIRNLPTVATVHIREIDALVQIMKFPTS